MSASLVGSEMCIRDRQSPTRAYGTCMHKRSFTTQQGTDHTAWHDACAVSYTHLTLPTICSV
eukprot:8297139-Alexandrium_andersonii.AAC.1